MSDAASPKTRMRRKISWRVFITVVAVGLLAVAYASLDWDEDESFGSANQPPAEWTADVPKKFGDPLVARESGDSIALTSQNGVTVFDTATGERRWQHEMPPETLTFVHGKLEGTYAGKAVTINGNTLVTREWKNKEKYAGSPTAVRGFDLETGKQRFVVEAEAGVPVSETTTANTLAFMECTEDDACEMTGYDLANGEEKWTFDREFNRHDLTWPTWNTGGARTDQDDLFSQIAEPTVAGEKSQVVLSEFDPRADNHGAYRVTVINVNSGEDTEWDDTVDQEAEGETHEYTVFGDQILRFHGKKAAVLGTDSGKPKAEFTLKNEVNELIDGSIINQSGPVLEGNKILEAVAKDGSADVGEGIDSYRTIDLDDGKVSNDRKVHGLLVGAAAGRVVTLTDTEKNPVMRGFDVASGEQSWKQKLYPASAEAEGINSTVVRMDGDHLALTSSPQSYDPKDFRGQGQTRVVSLSDGDTTVIDNVSTLSLGDKGMLGHVHAVDDADGKQKARLAYYSF